MKVNPEEYINVPDPEFNRPLTNGVAIACTAAIIRALQDLGNRPDKGEQATVIWRAEHLFDDLAEFAETQQWNLSVHVDSTEAKRVYDDPRATAAALAAAK